VFKRFSDTAVIEGIRKQDNSVLNWLYDSYFPLIKKYINSNSGNSEDASDIFQETIILLYNQIKDDKIKVNSDLKSYFFGIAKNLWSEVLRTRTRTQEIISDIPDEDDSDTLTDQVLERIVARALPKLKSDAREVIELFAKGISYDEIATILDLKSESYARRKKYLSKEALMEIIKEDPEYQEYMRLPR